MISSNVLILVSSLLANTSSAYKYDDFSTWDGFCPDGVDPEKPQQTPIDIPTASVTGKVDMCLVAQDYPDLELQQSLVENEHGLLMILETVDVPDEDLLSFYYEDVHYELDHVHSHWGSSEHLIDGVKADGNFHLVFKGFSHQALWTPLEASFAVIEIMVQAVSEVAPGVLTDFPRCPDVERTGRFLSDETRESGGCPMHVPKGMAALATNQQMKPKRHMSESLENTLLDAMGWDRPRFGMVLNYVGSLTTPPCSGPVHWFVQTEPVKVHDPEGDILGCSQFANTFPHANDEPSGNYRPVQPVRSFTEFNEVSIRMSKDQCTKRRHAKQPEVLVCQPMMLDMGDHYGMMGRGHAMMMSEERMIPGDGNPVMPGDDIAVMPNDDSPVMPNDNIAGASVDNVPRHPRYA